MGGPFHGSDFNGSGFNGSGFNGSGDLCGPFQRFASSMARALGMKNSLAAVMRPILLAAGAEAEAILALASARDIHPSL